ncbi:MAG: hypothetical protein NT070_02430 [Cyanobacteria bacterium]|nr:hypothetical protein [Cyanobacteriota bacterium]
MTTQQLVDRITTLEQELVQIKTLLQTLSTTPLSTDEPWWQKVAGTFPDDEATAIAEQLGQEWRKNYQDDFELQ